ASLRVSQRWRRLRRKGNLRNDAQGVLCVVGIDGSPQILKPAPGGLIRHIALTWLNPGLPVVFIRRAGGPVHEVAAQLSLEFAHRLVTKEAIKIEKPDEQQIVLRPGSLVLLVLGPFGYLVGGEHVGYGEDARVSRADRGCVPSADVGFERFRSAINIVAAATCADLPSFSLGSIEDDPASFILSEPESWRLGFAARHDGLTNLRMARGVVKCL